MNPLTVLLLLPIFEVVGFIMMGDWLGLWPTLGLLALSAAVGVLLIRLQGLATLRRVQEAAARGEMPMGELFDGFCIVIGGILLILPGFISDFLALLLVIRPVRRTIARWMFGRMQGTVWVSTATTTARTRPAGPAAGPAAGPGVIDVDYHEVEPAPDDAAAGLPRLSESRWGTDQAANDPPPKDRA